MPKITDENRWTKGKSYVKYCYTVQDISKITGRTEGTLRNDICKHKLDMSSLVSISEYIMKFKNV